MEEYRVTICVRATNREAVENWLASYLATSESEDIPEFFWTVDDVEKGSAFDEFVEDEEDWND